MVKAKFLSNEKYSLEVLLLKQGIISKNYLKRAKEYATTHRISLIEALIYKGYVNDVEACLVMSQFYNVPYIDLSKFPISVSLPTKIQLDNYIKHSFIPWKKMRGTTYIVTSKITKNLLSLLVDIYTKDFVITISTSQKIIKTIQSNFSKENLQQVKQELIKASPVYSAKNLLNYKQKLISIIFVFLLILLVIAFPYASVVTGLLIGNIIFFINTIFKFFLFSHSCSYKHTSIVGAKEVTNKFLPKYTILLPLYKEKNSLQTLLNNIRKIKYPKSKLDVILIVEQYDKDTLKLLNKLNLEYFFRIICVPKSFPQTKPKACSYGLKFAKGKYVTIYDAEDNPDPDQLLKAVALFRSSDSNVACVQAKLNYYNRSDNFLSSSFSLEYAIWFDFLLKGLEAFKIPIPLGGTSNHFKTDKIIGLKAWDPYNVAEDADLGYRLAKQGYTTKILNSYTLEESPISIGNWLLQRARWIKGHIQTYIVHLRTKKEFREYFGALGEVGFHFFLIFPLISYAVQLFAFLLLFLSNQNTLTVFIKVITMLNGILWVSFSLFFAICVSLKNKWKNMIFSIMMHPFYYLLHSIAFFIAFYQLLFKTHYWNKTLRKLDLEKTNSNLL